LRKDVVDSAFAGGMREPCGKPYDPLAVGPDAVEIDYHFAQQNQFSG
jgi:hypothetical protein